MPDLDVAAQIVETVYHIQPRQIEVLPPLFDWRGIYRIRDAQDRVWLLRLLRLDHDRDALPQTARLLQWLEQQQHPAPRIGPTHDRHIVGVWEGWSSLLLSYVEGSRVGVGDLDYPDHQHPSHPPEFDRNTVPAGTSAGKLISSSSSGRAIA
jgi:hypothetical protein